MRLVIGTVVISWLAVGCGGIELPADREKKPAEEAPAEDNSGDQTAAPDDADKDEELLAELETDVVAACHESGYLFERRKLGCSDEILLATSFSCDRAGIREAFAATGFQIDVVLDEALGKEGFADDAGDGYSLDQCGETGDGRRIVHFVKRAADGEILVREIETHL